MCLGEGVWRVSATIAAMAAMIRTGQISIMASIQPFQVPLYIMGAACAGKVARTPVIA